MFVNPFPLASCLATCLIITLLLSSAFSNCSNTYLLANNKEDLPQYRFAEKINQVENATLLNYGFLDGGFYYAADVVPTNRFFCYFNIAAPDMWESQNTSIEAGELDFIVTRSYKLEQYGLDTSHYFKIDEATFMFDGVDFTYYLYQKTN